MAWFSGKVSLGNFPDFSEAVSKISEGVKSIEKNFDNALGIEGDSNNPHHDAAATATSSSIASQASGLWSTDLMSFMGQKNEDEDEDENDDAKSEKAESSQENEVAEADNDANATREPEGSNVETLKPVVNLASVEADDKSVETSTIIDEQANEIADSVLETKLVVPEVEESIVKKPIVTDNDKSEDVIITTTIQSETESGLHLEPTTDRAEQLEVFEVPDHKSTEHESMISSEDQGLSTAHEPDEVEPPHDLQKTDIADEPKRQDEETTQEVSTVEGVDASPEVTGEEAKPSIQVLDDVSEMVSNEGNTNISEHQAGIQERSSPGKSVRVRKFRFSG